MTPPQDPGHPPGRPAARPGRRSDSLARLAPVPARSALPARRFTAPRWSAHRRLSGRLVRLALTSLLVLLPAVGTAAAAPPPADAAAAAADASGVFEHLVTFEAVDPGAAAGSMDGRVSLRFPGRKLSRTLIQWVVALAGRMMQKNEYGYYNVRVSGEVHAEDGAGSRAVDRFDYRFDLPVGEEGDDAAPLALVFENDLRPGSYEVELEVEDLAAGRVYRARQAVLVPDLPADVAADLRFDAPFELEPPRLASLAPAAEPAAADRALPAFGPAPATLCPAKTEAPAAAPTALPRAAAAPAAVEPSVRLLRPRAPILVGLHRFAAVAEGPGVDRVTFLLDGRPVLTKTQPPYEVELDLGDDARVRTLAAEAWAAAGAAPLARDELVLNTGVERFAVRLAAPADGAGWNAGGEGPLAARAVIDVPAGRRVAGVDFYLGDAPAARLDAPPFDRAVALPRPDGTTAVRAVVRLDDGRTAEDTRLVNARDVVDRIDVHLVELFAATVDGRGRSLDGLGAADFRVREDGVAQELVRCERVDGLPVHASLVLDVSASMRHQMQAVAGAALSFLERTLTPDDRASLIVFDRFPRLAVPFTADLARLANGLVGLRASGGTALHDGLIFALREMQGIDGQRTVLLFSDGDDQVSTVGTPQVLEYARRAGVTIHAVGLRIDPAQHEQRDLLRRLAEETGGLSAFVEDVAEVDAVYRRIEELMRSRYLLAYQSSQGAGDAFRSVDVELAGDGGEVRTVRGYYP